MIIHTPLFQPGGLNRIEFSGTSSYATFSSLSATASWATFSGTASFSNLSGTASYATFSGTASYATFSGTASYARLAGTASYATFSGTASYAGTSSVTRYTRGRYAFWAPYVSTDPTGMSASYTATSPDNQGSNGIRITSIATAGQNGQIYWNLGNKVDWKQDFRMEIVAYLEPSSLYVLGDGFVLSAGGSTISGNVYGNTADGALKFRLFTYAGVVDPHQAGASIWQNTTKVSQGLLGTSSFVNNWIRYTVEVAWNVATGRRHAMVYMAKTNAPLDYASKSPIAGGDVTAWEPGGGFCGVLFSTGDARSNQWVQQITFETL